MAKKNMDLVSFQLQTDVAIQNSIITGFVSFFNKCSSSMSNSNQNLPTFGLSHFLFLIQCVETSKYGPCITVKEFYFTEPLNGTQV